MSELKSTHCPSCGSPIEFNPNIESEVRCKYCGSYITKDDIGLNNIKVDGKVVDLSHMEIDDLHKLESRIKDTTSFRIKYNAHKLLVKSLGDKYEEFIKNKCVDIIGEDGNIYQVNITGTIQVWDKDKTKVIKEGQLYSRDYPVQDALVTIIRYIRYDCNGLSNLWGCGNIFVTGGGSLEGEKDMKTYYDNDRRYALPNNENNGEEDGELDN